VVDEGGDGPDLAVEEESDAVLGPNEGYGDLEDLGLDQEDESDGDYLSVGDLVAMNVLGTYASYKAEGVAFK